MKLTANMKAAGEMAIRRMTEKAQQGYYDTDPLDVFEYETETGTRYAVKNSDGITTWNFTFEDLQDYLESWVWDEDDD